MFEKKDKSGQNYDKTNEGSLKNPLSPAPGSAKVIIGAGVEMKGEITSASEVQIDGNADINMDTENLMVGQMGHLKGDIKTKNADIWGQFDGTLEVSNTLTIQEKGVVKGTTKYSALQIKLGGKLQGEVNTMEKPRIKAVPTTGEANSNKNT